MTMRHSLAPYFRCTVLALGFPAVAACGGNGSRTGTQTGDEGDTPVSTASTDTSSGGTAGSSGSSSSGETSTTSGTTTSVDSSSTSSSSTSASSTSASNTSDSTGAGGSSGGAANDSTSSTDAGGVAGAGAETGSDAPQTPSTSASTTGGGSSGADCEPGCQIGISCCDGECVNLANDINNCGACGVVCEGDSPYCAGSTCEVAPCTGDSCGAGETCCGSECCGAGELCCLVNQGPSVLGCFEPVNGTCPQGCPNCDCAAPDTPIATPTGERPIASLAVGDLVYSVDEHGIVVVPIVQVNRVHVENHHVMRVLLDDGTVLRISPRHPRFGSGVFADLGAGSELGERTVLEAKPVAYDLPFTHDILPGSSTGAYFAGGALIGSTLAD